MRAATAVPLAALPSPGRPFSIPSMHFNIEHDDKKSVSLWLAPDRPDAVPSVRVVVSEGVERVVSANSVRNHVRDAGVHDTGVCGFLLDDASVPGLSASKRLTIYEASTGLLLYRRAAAHDEIKGRLFRLETRILARNRLDAILQTPFRLGYTQIENYSGETIRSILDISYSNSIFASGRLPFARVQDQLAQRGFNVATLLGDPYREIFARLLLIHDPKQNMHLAASLAPPAVLARVQETLRKTATPSVESFAAALDELDSATLNYLSDPLTRQIIDAEPGQPLARDSAQHAMAAISSMNCIGVEADPGEFIETVWAVLGVPFKANGSLGSGPDPALSEQLRSQSAFRRLVRFDGVIFDTVCQAIASLPDIDEVEAPAPFLRLSSSPRAAKPSVARRG